MIQGIDDAPTGPIGGGTRPSLRGNHLGLIGYVTPAVLLVAAALLPWNLHFGARIPGSTAALLTVLLVVTLLSLASVALGSRRSPAARRLRLALNVPYIMLVAAFVVFDVVETVRWGGTVRVPGGVGPGAWLGIAGALLAAHPPATQASVRAIGYASILAAALGFGSTLYWRLHYALGGAGFGTRNVSVIISAVVYGAVALIAVIAASRWLLRSTPAARLATVALGTSALAAGVIVWVLPVGRDVDAFHGIAQNTSVAGVGFEGYLAWAAAAALVAPTALSAREAAWRSAARTCLALIALWCVGSAAMRATDLVVAASLDYPFSRYDAVVLAAFDLATALPALWLRAKLADTAPSPRLTSSVCGLVATLSIARVVVGVALAPRFAPSPNSPEHQPVYGNNLAHQITSTFDVTLCGLALSILAAAIVAGRLSRRRPARRRRGIPSPPAGSPRIFRADDSATGPIAVGKPTIYRPPQP